MYDGTTEARWWLLGVLVQPPEEVLALRAPPQHEHLLTSSWSLDQTRQWMWVRPVVNWITDLQGFERLCWMPLDEWGWEEVSPVPRYLPWPYHLVRDQEHSIINFEFNPLYMKGCNLIKTDIISTILWNMFVLGFIWKSWTLMGMWQQPMRLIFDRPNDAMKILVMPNRSRVWLIWTLCSLWGENQTFIVQYKLDNGADGQQLNRQ